MPSPRPAIPFMSSRPLLVYLFVILTIFSVMLPGLSSGTASFITFKADLPIMLMENSSGSFTVSALIFEDNKPSAEPPILYYNITNIETGEVAVENTRDLPPGKETSIRIPPLERGYYRIRVNVEGPGVRGISQIGQCGVSPAPMPYSLVLSRDGGILRFRSLVLNDTRQRDPNVTFRVELWRYNIGYGEEIIRSFDNITELNYTVPDEYQKGILGVDVVDINGWRNGAGVDFEANIYQGAPLVYDYDQASREPYKSGGVERAAISIILVVCGLALVLYIDGRR